MNSVSKREENLDALGDLSISQNADIFTELNNEQKIIRTRTRDSAHRISDLHLLARKLAHTNGSLFEIKETQNGLKKITPTSHIGISLLKQTSSQLDALRLDYPYHTQSPIFEAFACVARRIPNDGPECLKAKYTTEIANKIWRRLETAATLLRARLRSKQIRNTYSDFRRNAQKCYHSLISYIGACMRKRSNLIIVRLDLHLNKNHRIGFRCSHPITEGEITSIQELRSKFKRYIVGKFKNGLIGQISKLEIGSERGAHIHHVVMLDAAMHQQDISIAKMLGEEWKLKITNGRGSYFNCNAQKEIYRYPAIGKINTNNPEAIAGLRFMAAYFTLSELFVKPIFPKRLHTLNKGRHPKAMGSRGGRPSKHAPAFDISDIKMRGAIKAVRFI